MYGMSNLFGPFKLGQVDVMERAYESILEVINEETEKKGYVKNQPLTIIYSCRTCQA